METLAVGEELEDGGPGAREWRKTSSVLRVAKKLSATALSQRWPSATQRRTAVSVRSRSPRYTSDRFLVVMGVNSYTPLLRRFHPLASLPYNPLSKPVGRETPSATAAGVLPPHGPYAIDDRLKVVIPCLRSLPGVAPVHSPFSKVTSPLTMVQR